MPRPGEGGRRRGGRGREGEGGEGGEGGEEGGEWGRGERGERGKRRGGEEGGGEEGREGEGKFIIGGKIYKFVNHTDHFSDKFIIVAGHSELVQVVPFLPAILPEPHIVFRFRITVPIP